MPRKSTSLEAIRRQIDQIDDDVHRLLVKRAQLVGRVAAAKARDGGGPALRPEREAQVLRRLLKRNQGNLPPVVVARIWRELFPAMVRLQGPLEVIVCGVPDTTSHWDLARSHFGSATPMTVAGTSQRALASLKRINRTGGGAIAVLPLPSGRGEGRWWSKLMSGAVNAPRVIGKLPFVSESGNSTADTEAMVVGSVEWRPSGDDQTLIALETRPRNSARKVLAWLKAANLSGRAIATCLREGTSGRRLHLIQISEYVDTQDIRFKELRDLAEGAVTKAIVIGGYPTCYQVEVSSKSSKRSRR